MHILLTEIKAQGKNTTNITLGLDLPNIQVASCLEEITKMKEIELKLVLISLLHLHDTETLLEELENFERKTEELYNTQLRTIKNNWWKLIFSFIGTVLLLPYCCYICCPKCFGLVHPFRPCALINQTFNVCCTKNRSHRIVPRTTEDLGEEGIELPSLNSERPKKNFTMFKKLNN